MNSQGKGLVYEGAPIVQLKLILSRAPFYIYKIAFFASWVVLFFAVEGLKSILADKEEPPQTKIEYINFCLKKGQVKAFEDIFKIAAYIRRPGTNLKYKGNDITWITAYDNNKSFGVTAENLIPENYRFSDVNTRIKDGELFITPKVQP